MAASLFIPVLAEGYAGALAYKLRKKYGITEHMMYKLMDMNDGGKTFKQIADYIKKYVRVS